MAQWSRGMIPALGAGGPGFKSRLSPVYLENTILKLGLNQTPVNIALSNCFPSGDVAKSSVRSGIRTHALIRGPEFSL